MARVTPHWDISASRLVPRMAAVPELSGTAIVTFVRRLSV